ncbi:MAG: hypothetical protein IKJ88_07715 [Clostridia bacterium]|nr:hypothetical protein [Clostridia bacterium]
MKTVKKLYKQNKLVVISTILTVLCSEILCAVMNVLHYNVEWSSLWNSVLRIAMLSVAVFIAYKSGKYLSKYCLTLNFLIFPIFSVLSCSSGPFQLIYTDYHFYALYSLFGLIFLVAYYVEKCIDSVKCSLLYFFIGAVYVIGTYDEMEAFIALSMQLFLFVYVYGKIKSKTVKFIHMVIGFGSLFTLISLAVCNLGAYADIKFLEGSSMIRLLEALPESFKALGKSELIDDFQRSVTDYNPARIFAFYGYVVGGLMFAIITVFIVSVSIKAIENKSKMKPLAFVAAAVFSVQFFASIFLNCGVICGIEVSMPFISDDSVGYFMNGILLGLIFADSNTKCIEEYDNDYYAEYKVEDE